MKRMKRLISALCALAMKSERCGRTSQLSRFKWVRFTFIFLLAAAVASPVGFLKGTSARATTMAQFMIGPAVRVTPNVQVAFKWITDVAWFGKLEVFNDYSGSGAPVLTRRSEDAAGNPVAATQHEVTVPVAGPLAANTG